MLKQYESNEQKGITGNYVTFSGKDYVAKGIADLLNPDVDIYGTHKKMKQVDESGVTGTIPALNVQGSVPRLFTKGRRHFAYLVYATPTQADPGNLAESNPERAQLLDTLCLYLESHMHPTLKLQEPN